MGGNEIQLISHLVYAEYEIVFTLTEYIKHLKLKSVQCLNDRITKGINGRCCYLSGLLSTREHTRILIRTKRARRACGSVPF